MDDTLPLRPLDLPALLNAPFTPAMARAAGFDRAALERMLRAGRIHRLLRGVYADPALPDTREHRARAMGLVVGATAVVVDRSAAWVHGVDPWITSTGTGAGEGEPLPPVETLNTDRVSSNRFRSGRHLADRDVEVVEGLSLTSPLRTALDLGRLLPPPAALAALDGLLATGSFTHTELIAELPRLVGHRGAARLRVMAAQADGRARGAAESVLRLRWHDARLPSAVPGLTVAAGPRVVRLGLGVERCQFGAVLHERVVADELVALEGAGWRVLVLSGQRVLHAEPEVLMRHLEREFHQHLLGQIS